MPLKLLPQRLLLTLCFTLLTTVLLAQQKTVTGKITGANNLPISGATIVIKGTTLATITDESGAFRISVPADREFLVISFVGYEPKEVDVRTETNVSIALIPTTTSLNEVVVTGYTSQRKKDITGAVAVVNTAELKSIPASDATTQLQGRAPGVTVTQTGIPGSSAKVRIRGLGSFNNNSPLYVVDGVQTNSINGLNPNDIESMQVLKDASSASIYGVRGSNGVIVITTKKGRRNAVNVSVNMYYGVQDPGKGFDLLNAQEEAELTFLALKNSGRPITGTVFGNGDKPVLPDYIYYSGAANNGIPIMAGNPGVNPALYNLDYKKLGDAGYAPYIIVPTNKAGTNWYDEVTRTAPIQNYNVALSGGGQNSRFMFSVDYFDQKAITELQFYKRYTARLNSEFSLFDNHFRVGENIQVFSSEANTAFNRNTTDVGSIDRDNGREASVIAQTFRPKSIIPVYTIQQGDFAGTRGGYGPDTWGNAKNPMAILFRTQDDRNNNVNIFGNVYAELDFLNHFTARTSFGGAINTNNTYSYPFIEYEHVENTQNTTYNESFIRNNNWIWTNQLNYKNTFDDHDISVLVGQEAQRSGGRQEVGAAQGYFIYSYRPYINLNNGNVQNLSDSRSYTPIKTVSYFAKGDYTFKGRYIASALVRRDGSSKFIGDYRWGTFPAFSLGWRISDEFFMEPAKFVNDLKIRGSWGKMGNEAAASAENSFTSFGAQRNSSYYDISGTQNNPTDGFTLRQLANIFGQWEENSTFNIGFDATLFNGTTDIVFDWYKKKTDKLLYNPEVEGIRGSQRPSFQNVASMENNGVDVMISNRAQLTSALKLSTTLTFTTYDNEITSIAPGLKFFDFNSPANEANRIGGNATRNFVGSPLNTFYGYEVVGLFQSANDVSSSPTQAGAGPGRFKYADINGDKVINADDRTIIGNPNPDFTYGLNLGLEYKGFDFSTFFYGAQGRDIFNFVRWWTDFSPGGFPGGRSKRALYDSWLPDGSRPNAKTPIQETVLAENGFSTSGTVNSYYVENGSYLRMRNLMIGYTIPSSVLNRFKIAKARVYIQGTNLFTITDYSGLDPEVIVNDERAANIDIGAFPTVRQYLIGLSVNF